MRARDARGRRSLGVVGLATALMSSALAGVIASPASAAASPTWSVLASPSPAAPVTGRLHGVACPTTTSCFVVGSGRDREPLVGRGNGAHWSIGGGVSPGPSVIGPTLSAISCPAAETCFAVGNAYLSGYQPLIEAWDGASWSIVPAPVLAGSKAGKLAGIACTAVSSCIAVGSVTYATADLDQDLTHTLIERWDGTSWSVIASPNVAGTFDNSLAAVSCASVTSCYAVGSSGKGTLIERWDGTAWSIVDSNPAGSAASEGSLAGVSCSSSTTCVAVGSSRTGTYDDGVPDTETLIEHVNTTSVSVAIGPLPTSSTSSYAAVSCPTSTTCIAVGHYTSVPNRTRKTLVARFNGTSWTIEPGATGSVQSEVEAVSCPTTTHCVAVGAGRIGTSKGTTWSFVGEGGSQSELHGVSCASATSCVAVGQYVSGPRIRPLVERWNGKSWSFVPSPRPPDSPYLSRLAAVACPTSMRCFAVGDYQNLTNGKPLIEQWDGAKWSIVAGTAPAGGEFGNLSAISCATAKSCIAVGFYYSSAGVNTLVERWDGKRWSIVTSASKPALGLSAISCLTSTDCRAPTAHWDGSRWSVVRTPRIVGSGSVDAISCAKATSCFAVGAFYINQMGLNTLVERWDGSRWSIMPSPNPGGAAYSSALRAVSCASSASCIAVGSSLTGSIYSNAPPSIVLGERWDGTRWSLTTAPVPAETNSSQFAAVSCPTSTQCFGVGWYDTDGSRRTLIERYS